MQGGAMYALERGLNMRWLGLLFAFFGGFASFGIGCATQVNAIATVCNENLHIPPAAIGIAVAILTALVIFGGIKSIDMGNITDGGVLTTLAFQQIPVLGPVILVVGIISFAYSTVLGWAYYGERCVEYFSGKKGLIPYRVLYIVVAAIAPVISLNLVWTSDPGNIINDLQYFLVLHFLRHSKIFFAVFHNPKFLFPGKITFDFCRTSHYKRTVGNHGIFGNKTSCTYDAVTADLRAIKKHRPHPDQGAVSDGAAVNYRIMSYCDIISNMCRHVVADMDSTVFLNIGLLTNHNRSIITPDHCIIQHAAVTSNRYITYDHRLPGNPGTLCNFYIFIIHLSSLIYYQLRFSSYCISFGSQYLYTEIPSPAFYCQTEAETGSLQVNDPELLHPARSGN